MAFTPAHNGQIDARQRRGEPRAAEPVGLLAYVVTQNDPATGAPAKPVAAAGRKRAGMLGIPYGLGTFGVAASR